MNRYPSWQQRRNPQNPGTCDRQLFIKGASGEVNSIQLSLCVKCAQVWDRTQGGNIIILSSDGKVEPGKANQTVKLCQECYKSFTQRMQLSECQRSLEKHKEWGRKLRR
jgi:hypothetical protein